MTYKHSDEDNFLIAATACKFELQRCFNYCQWLLKRCTEDQVSRDLFAVVNLDMGYDSQLCQDYIKQIDQIVGWLQNPVKSTAQQRHDGRMLLAQIASWREEWKKGDVFRWNSYDEIPPTAYDSYKYTSPSVIPQIMVPGDAMVPGYDPFADDQ